MFLRLIRFTARRSPLAPLLLLGLSFGTPALVQAAGLPTLQALADGRFDISAEVRMLDDGRVLGELDPRRSLAPASLSKLYIAAAALGRYGPQHRFVTRLVSDGEQRGATLHGDLVLDSGGDPAMTTERYWTLVEQLAARGIERIDGRVRLAQWQFGPEPCGVADRCSARDATMSSYDARLSPVAVDYAAWCVRLLPTRPGASARVGGCFSSRPLVAVSGEVNTVAEGQPTRLNARRTTANGRDTLTLSGQVSVADGPQSVYRSASDPAQQTLATLEMLFAQSGIRVARGFAIDAIPPPAGARELASVESPPLQMALMDMLNYSNNFMADVLTIGLSASQPPSLASGAAALERFVDTVPGHGPVSLASGSGLTPDSRTSAHGLVALLDAMYRRAELFPTFVSAMQTPGNGAARFIRRGDPLFQRSVMIKTGTLNQPVPVRAIAGYFRTSSGRWGAFAVMLNGRAATPYLVWPDVLQALSSDLTPLIERY